MLSAVRLGASQGSDFQRASIAGGVPPPARLSGAKPRAPCMMKKNKTAARIGTAVGKESIMRKRNRTISIRCTEEEYERVHRKAELHGLKLNDFVLRSALGKKIIVAQGLDEVVRQQKAIGNNLNQLTRLAHEGKVSVINLTPLLDEYAGATALLSKALREVK